MNLPEAYYRWIFTCGGVPQFNFTYDEAGRVVLEGVAPTTASATDGAWTVQMNVYGDSVVLGGPVHQSTLKDVSWADAVLGLLTFP